MPGLDRVTARRWVARWDAQQQSFLPEREERFTAIADAVQAGTNGPAPLVLDLGCGPGSLAVRLLDRLPGATVVAVDADPLLLGLGRAAYGAREGLRFADCDLRRPGWAAGLALQRPADAAVSTTALHWIPAPELESVYRELAGVLRPGGLFLDGDHLREDRARTPVLARLERALAEEAERRNRAVGEEWQQWWAAAVSDPALAPLAAERQRRGLSAEHHGDESMLLGAHVRALRAAGFTEIGTLWQRGDNRVLCAVLGS